MTRRTTTTSSTTESEKLPADRDKQGRFVKGTSGNPAGRPKGKKNQITELKQDLEIAVRDAIAPDEIRAVVGKMVELALEGNVGAGKLILDKVLSNAKEGEDEKEASGQLKIIIENAALDIQQTNQNVIDVQAEEISNEQSE